MSRSLEEQRQDNVAKKKEAAIRADERKVMAEELLVPIEARLNTKAILNDDCFQERIRLALVREAIRKAGGL
jgi:hypothetical protein